MSYRSEAGASMGKNIRLCHLWTHIIVVTGSGKFSHLHSADPYTPMGVWTHLLPRFLTILVVTTVCLKIIFRHLMVCETVTSWHDHVQVWPSPKIGPNLGNTSTHTQPMPGTRLSPTWVNGPRLSPESRHKGGSCLMRRVCMNHILVKHWLTYQTVVH